MELHMNTQDRSEQLAASLSLSLLASQIVLTISEFLTKGEKPENFESLCRMAKRAVSSRATELPMEAADPTSLGLLPSPEQLKLIPEAIAHIIRDQRGRREYVGALSNDLKTIEKAKTNRAKKTKNAAGRLLRFFDVLGDLAINEARQEPLTEPED